MVPTQILKLMDGEKTDIDVVRDAGHCWQKNAMFTDIVFVWVSKRIKLCL